MNGFASSIGRLNIDFIYGRVPRLPEEGEEVFSESFDVQLGGGPAATMVNLHRLGVKTRFATFLGDDYLSEYAGHMLQSYGIPYCVLYRGTG
jgi:sugar/nucleoside kinase (ribokinase family)